MNKDIISNAHDGQPFQLAELRNASGMSVTLMDWGATLLSIKVPMKDGSVREVALGCEHPEIWTQQDACLGATIGRYANRIAYSRFELDGKVIKLEPNQGEHQLHGGPEGFNKRRWAIEHQNANSVQYGLTSPDGDQGFPGTLHATARFTLHDDQRLTIDYRAEIDKPCPVNMTNHVYFNLDGTQGDIRHHRLQVFADRYLPVSEDGIPTRGLVPVDKTSFNFRQPKEIIQDFMTDDDQRNVNGYDHAFLLNAKGDGKAPAARVWSSDGSLEMTVYTTAPALQVYTGNSLEGTPSRDGGRYEAWQGLALESEFLPDSPHHPEWPQPDCVLRPRQQYRSVTEYAFSSHK